MSEVRWYVLGSKSPSRELRIRDDVRRYGLESFVPLRYTIKSKKRILVPAVSGFIFVKGTLEEVKDYLQNAHFLTYIRKSTFSNKEDYLSVSLHHMENFMAVTEDTERHITYFRPDEITLHEGDMIRVKGGLYDGREGIIMRIKGKRNRHLVVQIPGILIAAVEMSPDMIELMESGVRSQESNRLNVRAPKESNCLTVSSQKKSNCLTVSSQKSKCLDKDRQTLFDIAHRLLFEIPDKYQNENEYYLLLHELERLQALVMPFKGYTPSAEAELALPLYMSAVMLQTDVEPVETRLRKAIDALKPSSLLRLRCQLYLAVLSKDDSLLSTIQSTVSVWRQSPLSNPQRAFIQEFEFLNSITK